MRRVVMLVERREDRRIALVAEAVQLLAQPPRPGLVARLGLERAQRLEVEEELPRLGSKSAMSQRRSSAGSSFSPNMPLHASSICSSSGPGSAARASMASGRSPSPPVLSPCTMRPVAPERGLAVRDEEQVDAAAPPLLGHRRAHPEPVGGPERPEALADLCRPVVERLRVGPRDPVDRPAHEHGVGRPRVRVDALLQPLRHLREALARVAEVADHDDPAITLVMRRLRSSASTAGGSSASTPAAATIG